MKKGQMIEIGRYRITKLANGKVWIAIIGDGEAMQTDETKLAAAIRKFYQREF